MKTILHAGLFILLVNFPIYGQKYYTLSDGEWNNTNSVWSLNGSTPCGCFPGNILNADTLEISHSIKMTGNVTVKGLSKMNIHPGGNVSNPDFDIFVVNSSVLAQGSISVRQLSIGTSGSFNLKNSSLAVQNRILIAGFFISNQSNIVMNNGNMEISSSGSLYLNNNSWLHFINGNIKNDGLVDLCSDCCISFDTGNVFNYSTGTFSGYGAIISFIGNIHNYGIWDVLISYCTSGTDTNVPNTENCSLADNICSFAPLPIELVYFKGYNYEGVNFLEWETSSETNSDYFAIEKSVDGQTWKIIGQIKAQGNSTQSTNYQYFDPGDLNKVITYYKLRQIDIDGADKFTKILSVAMKTEEDLLIYPNPSERNVTVQLQENCPYSSLCLLDASGRILFNMKIGDDTKFDLQLPEENGIYFIQLEGENFSKTYPITKM